jgi:hypothetical protein
VRWSFALLHQTEEAGSQGAVQKQKNGMDKFAKQQDTLAQTSTKRQETPVDEFLKYETIEISCWAGNPEKGRSTQDTVTSPFQPPTPFPMPYLNPAFLYAIITTPNSASAGIALENQEESL